MIKERELLEKYLEEERNNVFLFAGNYLMTQPRKGYEREFEAARERVELLEGMIDRM